MILLILLASLSLSFGRSAIISTNNNRVEGKFEDLCTDTLYKIGDYFEIPHLYMSRLNKKLNTVFKVELPFSAFVSGRLGIYELKTFQGAEEELINLHRLSGFKDSLKVFQIIKHDLIIKNRFTKLRGPLIRYLLWYYHWAAPDQKAVIDYYSGFLDDITDFMLKYSEFELLIETVSHMNPHLLLRIIVESPNLKEFFAQFDSSIVIKAFFSKCIQSSDVIVQNAALMNAILFNLPEIIYEKLLLKYRSWIFQICMNIIILAPLDTNKSELHERINHILDKYLIGSNDDQRYSKFERICRLFNDVRFGPDYVDMFESRIVPMNLNHGQLDSLIMTTSLANKKQLLMQLVGQDAIYSKTMHMLSEFGTSNAETPEGAKIIFDLSELLNSNLKALLRRNGDYLEILKKFYALKGIEYREGVLVLNFKAPSDLVTFGFPNEANFIYSVAIESNNYVTFLRDIWSNTRIIDVETFASFFSDYLKLPKIGLVHAQPVMADSDVLKVFARSESLRFKAIRAHIKFYLQFRPDETFFKEPVSGLNRFVSVPSALYLFTDTQTELELSRIEELTNKDLDELFLECIPYEDREQFGEDDYIRYRHVFRYWITGPKRKSIKSLGSPVVMKLLEQEFPLIMSELNYII